MTCVAIWVHGAFYRFWVLGAVLFRFHFRFSKNGGALVDGLEGWWTPALGLEIGLMQRVPLPQLSGRVALRLFRTVSCLMLSLSLPRRRTRVNHGSKLLELLRSAGPQAKDIYAAALSEKVRVMLFLRPSLCSSV